MRTLAASLVLLLALAGCRSTPAAQNGPSGPTEGNEESSAPRSSSTSTAAAAVATSVTYSCAECNTSSPNADDCPLCGKPMSKAAAPAK
jgi:hypothetical protein